MLFKDEAGRPEISPDGTKIAYHKKLPDGYYDIFICNIDGSGDKCITCDSELLPNKNIGQGSWHPSQEWIVFQAEKANHVLPHVGALAVPGIGYHNDVYIIHLKSGKVSKLTDLRTKEFIWDKNPSSAILQPHFSPSGIKLSWSERYDDGKEWGRWRIAVGDFKTHNGQAFVENIKYYQPGENKSYYESNDFLNDSLLLICGNLERNSTVLGLDIYILNLLDSSLIRLTHSTDYFDECPHPNIDLSKICYLSTEGFRNKKRRKNWWNWARGEFWLMNPDGSNKKQITYFNSPGHEHATGNKVIPAYISWAPDNSFILLGVAEQSSKRNLKDRIYRIRFIE